MRQACIRSAIAAAAALALATAMTSAAAHNAPHPVVAKAPGTVRIKLPDTALTDQDGRTARFRSEIVGDRLVLINFIYTTCSTACPLLSALFADLQQRLGERAGPEVALVSITVDPVRDTPLRLKAYSAPYQPGPAWRFLGGRKLAVDEVLKALDAYTPNSADHPTAVLVGDPRTGEWTRFFGFPDAEQVMARVNQLQAARAGAPLARGN